MNGQQLLDYAICFALDSMESQLAAFGKLACTECRASCPALAGFKTCARRNWLWPGGERIDTARLRVKS
ncbi:hypothetical protein [Paraburkholderia xenovorans]